MGHKHAPGSVGLARWLKIPNCCIFLCESAPLREHTIKNVFRIFEMASSLSQLQERFKENSSS